MNSQVTSIAEDDLTELIRRSLQQRGGKPAKYVRLEKHRDVIVQLMNNNIQLTLILEWLKKTQGEQLVLNTLRKYIKRNIGHDVYDEYLTRNGWLKTRRKPPPGAPPPPHSNTAPNDPATEVQKAERPPGVTEAAWIAEKAKANPRKH